MSEPVLVRELEQIRDAMQAGFHGVHTRLDTINGRLRKTEAAAEVLSDRSERNEAHIVGLEEKLVDLQTRGCAAGQLLHGFVPPKQAWYSKPVTQGVAGGVSFVGLAELVKAVIGIWK
ncbi:MAG: hypothetical protein PHR30_16510 [Gallionellaceae bacterium]|nr:hypothetical protein [Gallionellaceae bacterium]